MNVNKFVIQYALQEDEISLIYKFKLIFSLLLMYYNLLCFSSKCGKLVMTKLLDLKKWKSSFFCSPVQNCLYKY